MVKSLIWWLVVCLASLFTYIVYDFGLLIPFYVRDVTMLTYLITVIFIGTTISIGYKNVTPERAQPGQRRNYTNEWFISDAVLTLGMIGTIVGFIIMLAGTFNTLQVTDADSVRLLISSMSKGLYTALNTTLA